MKLPTKLNKKYVPHLAAPPPSFLLVFKSKWNMKANK